MDQRTTLDSNEKFDSLLREAKKNGESIRLLYDDGGLQRAEGRIIILDLEALHPSIVLDNDCRIFVDSIIGLNAVFRDDYSEC